MLRKTSCKGYKIASTNGLSGNTQLTEGQTLRLPSGVTRNTHNANTFQPYDPSEAIGDIAPTAPEPPKDGAKCGVFGQVLLAVVAVAVTVVTGSPVLGNLASQAVGLISGIQEKFSFKSLAMAYVTQGFEKLQIGAKIAVKLGASGALAQKVVGGAINSAGSQAVGVATGLQDKFSWTSVAAAGISAGVGHLVGQALPGNSTLTKDVESGIWGIADPKHAASYINGVYSGTASAIANAATRSVIDGTNFGDSIVAALPDVLGQVFGGALGGAAGDGFLDKFGPLGDVINTFNQVNADIYGAVETVGQGAIRLINSAFAAPVPTSRTVNTRFHSTAVLGEAAYLVADNGNGILGRTSYLDYLNDPIGSSSDGLTWLEQKVLDEGRLFLVQPEFDEESWQNIIRAFGSDLRTSNITEGEGGLANGIMHFVGATLEDPKGTGAAIVSAIGDIAEQALLTPYNFSGAIVYTGGSIYYSAIGEGDIAADYRGYSNYHAKEATWGLLTIATLGELGVYRSGVLATERLAATSLAKTSVGFSDDIVRVYTAKEANSLAGPHIGVIYVEETVGFGKNIRAELFDKTVDGVRYSANGKRAVPAFRTNLVPSGLLKLDGSVSGASKHLLDAKTAMVSFPKTITKMRNIETMLKQNAKIGKHYKVTYEFPTQAKANAASRIFDRHRIRGIDIRVRPHN